MDPWKPFNNALATARQAAEMEYNVRRQRGMDEERQSQNALANQYRQMQIDQMQQQQAREQNLLSDLNALYQPQQVGGPLANAGSYMPVQEVGGNPSQQDIGRVLLQNGMAKEALPMLQPKDQYEGLDGGYETFLRANRMPNSPEAYQLFQRNVLEQKRAGAPKVNIDTKQTPGRKKADEAFAQEYVEFNAAGGYADVDKQLSQLDDVVKKLESGKNLTGPVIGSIPDSIGKFTNPESIAVRDAVEEVVQRNLRLVLGAQFTEKEGERLISRAYNLNLDEKENLRRVKRLIRQIRSAAKAKESSSRYFAKHGTLTGWKGKQYTMSDFMNINKPAPGEETGAKDDPLGIR